MDGAGWRDAGCLGYLGRQMQDAQGNWENGCRMLSVPGQMGAGCLGYLGRWVQDARGAWAGGCRMLGVPGQMQER